VAHQPEFLPWLGFVSKAAMGDIYLLLDSVDFKKRNWQHRNRIRIKSDKGWKWLIVPLVRASIHGPQKLISDVKIAKGSWIEEHLRAIKFSYSRAPYFVDIFNDLESLYNYEGDDLSGFNTRFVRYAFHKFGINIPIYRTSELIKTGFKICGQKTDLIISMCQAAGAKTFVSGPSGKDYLEREKFVQNNVSLVFQSFRHPEYRQIHGAFIPCMSFIDLLFNYGTESIATLGKSDLEDSHLP